jgi:hypothetical protein
MFPVLTPLNTQGARNPRRQKASCFGLSSNPRLSPTLFPVARSPFPLTFYYATPEIEHFPCYSFC